MTEDQKRQPLVIYHKHCLDGFTAMWCAYRAIGGVGGDIEVWGMNPGQKPPSDVTGRDVFILDFSFRRADLIRMHEQANSLLVLDHHKSAEEELGALDFCQFDMERSGAGMAWDHFFAPVKRPWLVDYVEAQDIWKWDLPHAEEVFAFLNIQPQMLERWDNLNASVTLEYAVGQGRIIKATHNDYIGAVVSLAREAVLCGHHVPVINASFWQSSYLLNRLAATPMKDGSFPLFAVGWHQKADGTYKYSLRSCANPDTGVAFDTTAVAKVFKGGGHHKASAFVHKTLLF